MIDRIIQYIVVTVSVLSVLAYSYFRGKSDSKNEIEATHNKKKLEDIKVSKKVENEVEKVPNSDLDSRLSRWMRND